MDFTHLIPTGNRFVRSFNQPIVLNGNHCWNSLKPNSTGIAEYNKMTSINFISDFIIPIS